MGIHDIVDIAGESKGEFGHRDQQRVAAACSRAFNVHGRAAAWLAQGAAHIDTAQSHALHQAAGGCALSFAQGRRGDRGNFNVYTLPMSRKPVHDFKKIKLGQSSHGQDFIFLKPKFVPPFFRGGHVFLGSFRYLPVGHFYSVVSHVLPS